MFQIFQGSHQPIMLNPYQVQWSCQTFKPKPVRVIKIKAHRPHPTEKQAVQHVLSVEAKATAPSTELDLDQEDIFLLDPKEFTQDLIAAENLIHIYDDQRDDFSQVTKILRKVSKRKKKR